jgi:hypothetical protein
MLRYSNKRACLKPTGEMFDRWLDARVKRWQDVIS